MNLKFFILLIISTIASAAENEIPNREPDIKSIPARLEDYYTYDKITGQWIWKEDYQKFKERRIAKQRKQLQAQLQSKSCPPCPCQSIEPLKKPTTLLVQPKPSPEPKEQPNLFVRIWVKISKFFQAIWKWIVNLFK